MKKIIAYVIGIFFLILGLIGLIMPILPGWIFIFMGLSLIAPRLAMRLKQRFFRKFIKKNTVYLEDWHRERVEAGFTTRRFPFLIKKTDEFLEVSNQERFKKAFSKDAVIKDHKVKPIVKCVTLNQVHGGRVEVLTNADSFKEDKFYHLPEADGVITNIQGLTLLVLTADCLSVFFRAPGWVGVVHAGWRGSKEQITAKAFKLILEHSKAQASEIFITFGPCIGRSKYEVGEEFKDFFPQSSLIAKDDKLYFDLAGENRRQLLSAGAVEANILDLEICTVEENENFYSFRKEKETAGRSISFITRV